MNTQNITLTATENVAPTTSAKMTKEELQQKSDIELLAAEKKCRVYDFLATCDQEDFCNMFDSSAFNEISKSYMRLAVKELTDEGTIDEEQAKAVRNRFSLLFDEKQAHEVI